MDRFISKFQKTDTCWLWTASCSGDGYGAFTMNGKNISAHRASYLLYKGEIPDNTIIRHICDTPKCVNPEHLIPGSIQDNTDDKTIRNRQAKGSKINTSKLTEKQVIEIRNKYSTNMYGLRKLAKEYNVFDTTIWNIVNKKSWKHI